MNTKISIRRAKIVNGLTDPTIPFTSFMKFKRNDLDMELHFLKSSALTPLVKEQIFSIMRENMMEAYKKCPWGWNESKKRAELFHKEARYILVRHSSDKTLAGFVHFRFDIEDLVEVLYLYEIQLKPNVRGKGLGKYLMSFLETLTFHYKMQRIVLTVLKSEVNVIEFYYSLQYSVESYSPKDGFYYILSKKNKTLELVN